MATARERLDRPRPRSLALLAFGATALLALPASASAHQTVAEAVPQNSSISSVPAPAAVRAVTGARTVTTDAGLYRVTTAVGEPVLTHGPDTRAASESRESGLAPDGTGFAAGRARAPTGLRHRLLPAGHLRPHNGNPERIAAATAQIRTVIGRMDAVLNSESLASGGPGADYKMLCDGSGQVRVDRDVIGGTSFAEVVSSARAAGYNTNRRRPPDLRRRRRSAAPAASPPTRKTRDWRSTIAATSAAATRSSTSPAGRARRRCTRAGT